MSVNTTSPSNVSLDSLFLHCPDYLPADIINNAHNLTRILLLLPLSILILFMGYRQRRQQGSFKAMSHCDIFTCHNAAMELVCVVGSVVFLCGFYFNLFFMRISGYWISSLTFSGETCFHLLTCVERYLAVVHPVTYRGLRNARGVTLRHISVGLAWLLSFTWSSVLTLVQPNFPTIQVFCLLAFCVVTVSFCSLSVLCALVRPGPGEGGGGRRRVDPSKKRAFLNMMVITGVLWLWFVGFLLCFTVGLIMQCENISWTVMVSGFWFSVPSSLVLPLLYLHRTGSPSCFRYNTK